MATVCKICRLALARETMKALEKFYMLGCAHIYKYKNWIGSVFFPLILYGSKRWTWKSRLERISTLLNFGAGEDSWEYHK